jgi:tetratricopeptide (TPR) repeat protein
MKFDAAPTIVDALDSALNAFRSGDFEQAEVLAETALALDFEHGEVQSALKCAVFWKDRLARATSLPTPEERGDLLLKEWQGFVNRFRAHLDEPFEAGIEAIRGAIFDRAASWYLEQVPLEQDARQGDLRLKAARAWKSCGSYDQALSVLDAVLQARPDDAGALAEMADCFEAVGETQKSRLFFREAFYLNAQAVNLDALKSLILGEIAHDLVNEGHDGAELKEWIPVYAVIRGFFSVKRDLKALELGQLKQGINVLKAELHEAGAGPLALPRLLNRYFWLIDHYFSTKEDRSKVEDILLNIKLLDQRIYELYTH